MGFTQSHLVPNVGKIQDIVVDLFGDWKGLALGVVDDEKWILKRRSMHLVLRTRQVLPAFPYDIVKKNHDF